MTYSENNMLTGLMQIKLLSYLESNKNPMMFYYAILIYSIYTLIYSNRRYLKHLFSNSMKYSMTLEVTYILPGPYTRGHIDSSSYSQGLSHDLYMNRDKYNIPEFLIYRCTSRERTSDILSEYVYIPDHNVYNPIKIKFGKGLIILKNISDDESEKSASSLKDKKAPETKIFKFSLSSNISMGHINDYLNNCKKNLDKYKHENENKDALIYRYINSEEGRNEFQSVKFQTNKRFENLFLEHKTKNTLIKAIDTFFTKPEIYKKYGTPHKLGILLYGPPGTGKTSVVKAAIEYIRKYKLSHIYDIDLTKISSNEEATNIFLGNDLRDNILVLEEFDRAECVKKRKKTDDTDNKPNTDVSKKLDSLDKEELISKIKMMEKFHISQGQNGQTSKFKVEDFLKIFDGIQELSNVIYFATTNHIENIDPAVLRRFDMNIELSYQTSELIKEQLELYYDTTIKSNIKLPNNLMSGCQVEQICKNTDSIDTAISNIQERYLDKKS